MTAAATMLADHQTAQTDAARKTWRTAVFSVAGGAELTHKMADSLNAAGEEMGVDDVPETFQADVELVQRIASTEKHLATIDPAKLVEDAKELGDEIVQIERETLPRLRNRRATLLAERSSWAQSKAEIKRLKSANDRLFS